MMAVSAESFDTWLSKKLKDFNTDEGVFGTYIKGILEGDETEDEKCEALEGILSGITVRAVWNARLGRTRRSANTSRLSFSQYQL